jgi:hypothetical protein
MSAYAVSMSLLSDAASVAVPGLSFTWRMNLPVPCNKAGQIRQRCTVKEPHIYVRSEYIDIAEGRIAQTCNRTAVMQDLLDFVPAFSHHLKPLTRDGPQFASMLFHPRIDGGIAFDSTVESQQLRSHGRSIFAFGIYVTGPPPTRGTKEIGPQKRRRCRECF